MKLKAVLEVLPKWQQITLVVEVDADTKTDLYPSFSKENIPACMKTDYNFDVYLFRELLNKEVTCLKVSRCDLLEITVKL